MTLNFQHLHVFFTKFLFLSCSTCMFHIKTDGSYLKLSIFPLSYWNFSFPFSILLKHSFAYHSHTTLHISTSEEGPIEATNSSPLFFLHFRTSPSFLSTFSSTSIASFRGRGKKNVIYTLVEWLSGNHPFSPLFSKLLARF